MITDLEARYQDEAVITTAVNPRAGDVYDHGPGVGGPVNADYTILAQVTKAFDTGGTSVRVLLEQSTAVGMGSPDVVFDSGVLTGASGAHPAGTVLARLQRPLITKRFTRFSIFTAGTYTGGGGAIFIGVVGAHQRGEPTA